MTRIQSLHSAFLGAVASAAVVLSACDQRAPAAAPPAASQPATASDEYPLPPFVDKVWLSTTPGHARGSIRVFLSDKTLLMDSCFETFRIEQWGVVDEDEIRWIEDRIPIQARYEQPRADTLRLQIAGRADVETYTAASAPYLCPEMAR